MNKFKYKRLSKQELEEADRLITQLTNDFIDATN